MQNDVLITHAKIDRKLFILDLAAPRKVMQVNIQAMMIRGRGKPTHLVSYIKKIRIKQRRFGHVSNARVIRASKLLTRMGDIGKNYDFAEIYSDSKASLLKKSINNPNSIDIDSTKTNIAIETMIKVSKITNSNFDEICKPYIENKQTRVMRRYKPITPTEEKLEEVHIDLSRPHNPPSLSTSMYVAILMCENENIKVVNIVSAIKK